MTLFRRAVTNTGGINISRQIRGPALERDVMLTLCPEGIIISPCGPEAHGGAGEDGKVYQAKSYFNQYNRLFIPQCLTQAARIERFVQVSYRPDGTLLVTPDKGDFCALCGGTEQLHDLGKGKLVCHACIEKMYTIRGGGSDEK